MRRTVTKRKGGDWQTTTELVEVDELKLDPENVRFRHVNGVLSQEQIEKMIWEEFDTRELLKQIIASGGLTTPPIITADRVVKAGNRRVVACRKARELIEEGKVEGFTKDALRKIECEVLPSDVEPVSMKVFLAREHVTGKKQWDALNRAALIHELYNELGRTYDDIRDLLGIGKAEVIRKTKAFDATVRFIRKYPKAADIRKFVYFDELYKRRGSAAWADASAANLERFEKWIACDPPKITDNRQLRRLPDVLENPEALALLDSPKGGMEAAIKLLDVRRGGGSRVFKAITKASDELDRIPRNEYRAIAQDKTKADVLRDLHAKIETILEELGLKF